MSVSTAPVKFCVQSRHESCLKSNSVARRVKKILVVSLKRKQAHGQELIIM